jgi:hypothetical protein
MTDDPDDVDHTDDETDDPDELDADEPRLPGPRAAYAVNWKTVLAVDAAMGAIVAAGGFIVLVAWNFAVGVLMIGLGLLYVAMVARRGRQWQYLRRQAGL